MLLTALQLLLCAAGGANPTPHDSAQIPVSPVDTIAVNWAVSYGGDGDEWAEGIVMTEDAGILLVAGTDSFGAGSYDFWILRLNSQGSALWQKAIGGAGREWPESVATTGNGGFLVAGQTNSYGAGGDDAWVMRIDDGGEIVWERTFGGKLDDWAITVLAEDADTYIICGGTESTGAGRADLFLMKINGNGEVIWQRTYGGQGDEGPAAMRPLADGGYLAAVVTNSFGSGGTDIWLVRLDPECEILWDVVLGGSRNESVLWAEQTSDGGFVVAGWTESFGAGGTDALLMKLNDTGELEWQRVYGTEKDDWLVYAAGTSEDTLSAIGAIDSVNGLLDIWFVETDTNGNVESHGALGGTASDTPEFVCQLEQGTLLIGGRSFSFSLGWDDCWLTSVTRGTGGDACQLVSRSVSQAETGEANCATSEADAAVSPRDRTLLQAGSTTGQVTRTEADPVYQCGP